MSLQSSACFSYKTSFPEVYNLQQFNTVDIDLMDFGNTPRSDDSDINHGLNTLRQYSLEWLFLSKIHVAEEHKLCVVF